MRLTKTVWIFGLVAVLTAPDLAAQGKGKGRSKGSSRGVSKSIKHAPTIATKNRGNATVPYAKGRTSVGLSLRIKPSEKTIIAGYAASCLRPGAHVHGLPPGLAKNAARGKTLPPGWQKKCVVGSVMPLAVFEVCHPLPTEVHLRLPPSPPGTTLVAVDGRVFRVCKKTRKIHGSFVVYP